MKTLLFAIVSLVIVWPDSFIYYIDIWNVAWQITAIHFNSFHGRLSGKPRIMNEKPASCCR